MAMRRPSNVVNLNRLRQSFRKGALQLSNSIREEARQGLQKVRKVPRWVRILRTIYHDYGLKHICLISILILYQFFGAAVFYYYEKEADEIRERNWEIEIRENRTVLISRIIPLLFNNTEYLFFLTHNQTIEVSNKLGEELVKYEIQLGIKHTDQKIPWDFWNAMLYAQTICTTIGYGHLYATTFEGRLFTMIYAIFGIPLVLSILDDLGKLLTRCLKTPWWLVKCVCRRAFRYCTKQTMDEIKRLDAEDKRDLEIFDLPVPIAIGVVVAWIFICSATFCIWESEWDYFVAFYFFFISLSTIGLGDITPTQPRYLLMLFIYIIIGLSLVSMCINLIQAKLERTYEAGRKRHHPHFDREGGLLLDAGRVGDERHLTRRGSALGVFRTSSSVNSMSRDAVQTALHGKKRYNKTCQTVLSFPSPTKGSLGITRSIRNAGMKFLPRSLSIDDVMKLVDTEEGDILILTELVREESGISTTSNTISDISGSQIVISKSFDANFSTSRVINDVKPSHPSLHDIEALEEMEDRIALSHANQIASTVQFRSRLSLIAEQSSAIEESDESAVNSSIEKDPLSPNSNTEPSPPSRRRPLEARKAALSNILKRKSSKEGSKNSDRPGTSKN
ncbi:unnamed protein product, partial [Mesorhabditis belari]|uniref:Potassium channel domain-containing protein n=1 Tax=Mesorhabditis belari TaxID=2138241 RepID=A0AAF3FCJ1_9BILA